MVSLLAVLMLKTSDPFTGEGVDGRPPPHPPAARRRTDAGAFCSLALQRRPPHFLADERRQAASRRSVQPVATNGRIDVLENQDVLTCP
jgi:hypothetical protein